MAVDRNGPANTSRANGSSTDTEKTTSPYVTTPDLIPEDDPFISWSVQYGRYDPQKGDFKPRYNDWWQSDPKATSYWEETVKSLWTSENSLNVPGTREAFAAGSIILRVDQEDAVGTAAEMFSCVNANELSASRKAEDTLKELGVAVPVVHYCGTISGKNVTVESRIPGVSLDVAWRYLTAGQIETLKKQCRHILQRLGSIDTAPDQPSYVCRGLNSHSSSRIQGLERGILFNEDTEDEDLLLVHNNLALPNIIVNNDRVVGITGWRESGYFGFERARKIHRQIRVPQTAFPGDSTGSVKLSQWADLYENLESTTLENGLKLEHNVLVSPVKTEPSNMSLDKVPLSDDTEPKSALPQLDGADLPEEHPTPKKVASLKNRGNSRASSSDRSSPANSAKPGAAGKRSAPGGAKKGPGRKPTKKRKLTEQDSESVDGRRSNTPLSSVNSKVVGTKNKGSASVANSPVPEGKKKAPKRQVVEEEQEDEEEDSEDNDEVFCICRKPDNHTWMIGCDGGCEDWFHGKCVNIDPRDAELIEKYICPNCKENGKGWTTWKPMCRLKGCRKPARLKKNSLSKYCSDEHGREFMRQKTQHLDIVSKSGSQKPNSIRISTINGASNSKDDDSEFDGSHVDDGPGSASGDRDENFEDLGSRGGVLTSGDLAAVIMGVISAEEFRKLGAHIVSPPPEDKNTESGTNIANGKKLGLDIDVDGLTYSPDEAKKIEKLRKQRDELIHRKEILSARNTFLTLIRQRSKSILELLKKKEPKGGWKDICGFDMRLAWSDEEFDEWRLSDLGKRAFQEGTAEALASSYPDPTDADGDTAMDGVKAVEDDLTRLSRGVCTKKRCERHKQWLKVHQQDAIFEENTLMEDLTKCEKEAQNVVERAVLRMWAEKDNAQIGNQ